MARKLKNWLEAYLRYTEISEAPPLMHFWSGVWALSGALRRRVWFDQVNFQWYPNFYIIFVAKPGLVAKSTTVDIARDLLKHVEGVTFGPSTATWESLAAMFPRSHSAFPYGTEFREMSPLVFAAREFGSLVDFSNPFLINFFIEMWDCPARYDKETKSNGSDNIISPWVSIISGTTPSWMEENMRENTMGGGFASRCIFIHIKEKARFIPHLDEVIIPEEHQQLRLLLIEDLQHISTLVGRYKMTPEARAWGHRFYEELWSRKDELEDSRFDHYIARKQAHVYKTAMAIAAAQRDALVLEESDFAEAAGMLKAAEGTMGEIFAKLGQSKEAGHLNDLLAVIQRRGEVPYEAAYQLVHQFFPHAKNFEDLLAGLVKSGKILFVQTEKGYVLKCPPSPSN